MMGPLLWLVSFPLETAAGWLLLGGSPGRIIASVAVHAAACCVFGCSLLRARGRGWPMVGFTLSLVVFPLAGMLAAALAYAAAALPQPRWRPSGEPEVREEDPLSRARRVEISLLEEREVEPVVDVLREEDPEAKRAAIERLALRRDSEAIRVLRGLLHDPSPEARLFASLTLSRLEDEIGKEILAARRDAERAPEDPAARERLADLYLEYALSGLLEDAARDYYLRMACEEYEAALRAGAGKGRNGLRLARAHLGLGEIAQAAGLLDELGRERPDDPEVHLLRMETIFDFGDLRELKTYARRVLGRLPEGSEARELAGWWAGEAEGGA
ncbi:HEAT repeat domain-containing protein [Rubrobacter xylanophilus]|nr:HEAT repeat domain-containing protein [Rubrobacter xylanophilus]